MPTNAPPASFLCPPAPAGDLPLVPVRMVSEFFYCPRSAYLMWPQSEWEATADIVEGLRVHARVDRAHARLPEPEMLATDGKKIVSRSLALSSETLGVTAKMDIVEAEDGAVTPVEYKRGKRPHVAHGAHAPTRIQVCLQALLLEEHGYLVKEGAVYYAHSRERVRIALDDQLRDLAKDTVRELRATVAQGQIPPPLQDSPKCPRCSLVAICMPDEVRALNGSTLSPRPIAIASDQALPLVVQSHRAHIRKQGNTLRIADADEEEVVARMIDVSDVALFGNVSITTSALTALLEREIPIAFHSFNGWFQGLAHGVGHRNVEVRTAQYRRSFDADFCMRFSKGLVAAKIFNQRTMLRRNWRGDENTRRAALNHLRAGRRSVQRAMSLDALRGVEGDAAAVYFRAFSGLLAAPGAGQSDARPNNVMAFHFKARHRRPPPDPVNAMLSLAYAMLTRHVTVAMASVGLDPYRGFFHAPRYGRPALALDIMEPFRPIIADSVVLSVINTGEIGVSDFICTIAGATLTASGRRRFVSAFERRLSQEVTHPLFGYRLSMRRLLLAQARLLTRHLLGEIPSYPHHLPR